MTFSERIIDRTDSPNILYLSHVARYVVENLVLNGLSHKDLGIWRSWDSYHYSNYLN